MDTWTRTFSLAHFFEKFKTCFAPKVLRSSATSYLRNKNNGIIFSKFSIEQMNKFVIGDYIYTYLSSKLVVAAKLITTSNLFHISSLKLESFTPKSSRVMSPGTRVIFSEIRAFRCVPFFSFRTLNKSFPIICNHTHKFVH